MSEPTIIKKYGNRRLYDTADSRYVTLDELATKIQDGTDVRVVDAKTGADLTQATLTQIIIEGRGAARMLPVGLLTQLIRLGDDALAEFFGRYMTGALDVYLQAKRGVSAIAAYNPFATVPFAATDALARMWGTPFGAQPAASAQRWPQDAWPPEQAPEPAAPPAGEPPPRASGDDVASLRRELEELKRVIIETRGETRGPARDDRDDDRDDDRPARDARASRPAKARSSAKTAAKPAAKATARRSRKRSKPHTDD